MRYTYVMMRFIIFTDLDGTLLSHDTYDYTPALPTLQRLHEKQVPVILASSKTAHEILDLQKQLDLTAHPAIIENGAGILSPCADLTEQADASATYHKIIAALNTLPKRLRKKFIGFNDLSVEDVAEKTGLDFAQAAQAKQRCFSEPGIWLGYDDEKEEFLQFLKAHSIQARMGGRFLTLSEGHTKADRMNEILEDMRSQTSDNLICVALGDAPNDIEILEQADIGVIVNNPAHPPLPPLEAEKSGRIIRTKLPGPDGWAKAINSIIIDRQQE